MRKKDNTNRLFIGAWFLIFIQILSCAQKRPFSKSIKLTEVVCSESEKKQGNCHCSKQLFECNKNIYLLQNESDYDLIDSLPFCFTLKLKTYESLMSLDSIYYSEIQNKSLVYWPGFINGNYRVTEDSIFLDLEFINKSINTSRSTSHKYFIDYSKKDKKYSRVALMFIQDSTAYH